MADNKTTAQKAAQNENKRVTAIVEAFASFDTNDTGLVKNDGTSVPRGIERPRAKGRGGTTPQKLGFREST